MPDPNAHADDMLSPAEYVPPTVKDNETLPPLWWFNPWNTVLGLLHKVDHLKSTSRGEQASRINAEGLANLHQNERNAFLRKVELALKPACPHLYEDTIGYVQWAADEIKRLRAGLSVMTEDRDAYIEKLDRERGTHEATLGYARQLEEKVNHLEAKWPRDLWNGGKIYGDVYTCQPHSKTHSETKAGLNPAKLAKENQSLRERLADEKQAVRNLRKYLAKESRLLRKEQAKVNKLERAQRKPLWEDKTAGASFTFGNHEDRPGMSRKERLEWLAVRASLGSINNKKTFRHGIKPKAKPAKKKGGAK